MSANLPLPPPLTPSQIHLWLFPLDREMDAARTDWLSPEESARAARLLSEPLQRRFAAGRAILRGLLAGYLDTLPGEVPIVTSEHGRPGLPDSDLDFNLAHTGDWVVFAFARAARLGVDLESLRPVPDLETIVKSYFAPAEREQILSLAGSAQTGAFFRAWTRKEAYLKARGSGLTLPLDSFSVSLLPGEPARLLSVAGEPKEPGRWWLAHLDPRPGLIGALALKGSPRDLLWCHTG